MSHRTKAKILGDSLSGTPYYVIADAERQRKKHCPLSAPCTDIPWSYGRVILEPQRALLVAKAYNLMKEIGLDRDPEYFNGSEMSDYFREGAIKNLPIVLEKNGLKLDKLKQWKAALKLAEFADQNCGHWNGALSDKTHLTNVWKTCQKAIFTALGEKYRIPGPDDFEFPSKERKDRWLAHFQESVESVFSGTRRPQRKGLDSQMSKRRPLASCHR